MKTLLSIINSFEMVRVKKMELVINNSYEVGYSNQILL